MDAEDAPRTNASTQLMQLVWPGGITVDQWRRRFRLLLGMQLLARGNSVTNAAVSAGYASTSAFIAAFKKTFGLTPGRLPAA